MVLGKGLISLFCMWISISPLNGVGTFVKNHLTISGRVCFLTLSSSPLVYMTVFIPVPHCFNYYSFVVNFKVRKYEFSTFIFKSATDFI